MRLFVQLAVLSVIGFHQPVLAAWQAILISGDSSINNFDNSRVALGKLLQQRGLSQQHHLTAQFDNATQSAHLYGIAKNFSRLNVDSRQDGCLFYISSHGQRQQGIYLQRAQDQSLTPKHLDVALDWQCGEAPTVVLISACYSGQFIPALKAPNRIILTASAANRPSFGCSEDTEYTFWDGCMIENLPKSDTWQQLGHRVQTCIRHKEQVLGFPASEPQVFLGSKVENLTIDFH